MNKMLGLVALTTLSLCQPAFAGAVVQAPMDKVALRLASEQWVKTDDAKVTVTINAVLHNQGLITLRRNITNSLNKIGAGEWHITSFNRRQDRSGLESVYASAEARLGGKALGSLRTNAKRMSRPGLTYRIANIDFKPSMKATEVGRHQARQAVYEQINLELARLRKTFPGQHYTVAQVSFIPYMPYSSGQRDRSMMMEAAPRMAGLAKAMPAMQVSQKVTETALVVLAANRDTAVKK